MMRDGCAAGHVRGLSRAQRDVRRMCRLRWSFLALGVGLCLLSADVARAEKALKVGDVFPNFSFVNIDEQKAHTKDFKDRVMVVTAADRDSSERLMAWMRLAGLQALRANPDLKIAYVSVADVTAVPRLFKGIARKAISYVNESSNEEFVAFYKEHKVVPRKDAIVSHLIPDWDGQIMGRLGIKNAEKFKCWIVSGGKVVAALPEGTSRLVESYTEAVSRVQRAKRAKAKPPQPSATVPGKTSPSADEAQPGMGGASASPLPQAPPKSEPAQVAPMPSERE